MPCTNDIDDVDVDVDFDVNDDVDEDDDDDVFRYDILEPGCFRLSSLAGLSPAPSSPPS